MTSKLTGWHVDIEPETVQKMGFEEKMAQAVESVASISGISREQADILVHHGLKSLEDILQAEVSDLAEIPGIADQAAAILDAVKAEASRRQLRIGETSAA